MASLAVCSWLVLAACKPIGVGDGRASPPTADGADPDGRLPALAPLRAPACGEPWSTRVEPQHGRVDAARSLALDHDGELAALGGYAATEIWDLRSGARVATLPYGAEQVAFVPGSSRLVLAGPGIRVWDLATGTLVVENLDLGFGEGLYGLRFTPAGQLETVEPYREAVDLTSGQARMLARLPFARAMAASASGERFVTGDDQGELIVLDGEARELSRVSLGAAIQRVAISASGDRAGFALAGGEIGVVTLGSGHVDWRARELGPAHTSTLRFDPDGDGLWVAFADHSLVEVDAATGAARARWAASGPVLSVDAPTSQLLAWSGDGRWMLSYDGQGMRVHAAGSGAVVERLHATPLVGGTQLALAPDGRHLLVGDAGVASAWDLARLRFAPVIASTSGAGSGGEGAPGLTRIGFEPDGDGYLLTDTALRVFDVADDLPRASASMVGHGSFGRSVGDYVASQNTAVFGDVAGWMTVLDSRTGAEVSRKQIDASGLADIGTAETGDAFALLFADGRLALYDPAAGFRMLAEGLAPRFPAGRVRFGANHRDVLYDGQRWRDGVLEPLSTAPEPSFPALPRMQPRPIAAGPAGRWIVTGDERGCVEVLDAETGAVVHSLQAFEPGREVVDVAVSDRTGMVFAVAGDRRIRAWRPETGEALTLAASMLGWAAWRDDGSFAASRAGTELFALHTDSGVVRPEALALTLNRPGALLAALEPAGERADTAKFAATLEDAAFARVVAGNLAGDLAGSGGTDSALPTVSIEAAELVDGIGRVRVRVDDHGARVGRLAVRVDGVRQRSAEALNAGGPSGTGADTTVELRVPLHAGTNLIEVAAVRADGAEGPASLRALEGAADTPPGRLLYLGLGVSDYADPAIPDLRYAEADVQAVGEWLTRSHSPTRAVESLVLVGPAASRAKLAAARDFVANAKPSDTLVVFLAGHGKRVDGQYYFVGHEAELAKLAETGIAMAEIDDLLQRAGALRKLVLLDTCESGDTDLGGPSRQRAAIEAAGLDPSTARGLVLDTGPAPEPRSSTDDDERVERWLLDRDRLVYADLLGDTGATVLVSSRGHESSFEFPQLGHGVFTAALLESTADLGNDGDGDGQASTDELAFMLGLAVPQFTKQLQHPMIMAINHRSTVELPRLGNAAAGRDEGDSVGPAQLGVTAAELDRLVTDWYAREGEFAGQYRLVVLAQRAVRVGPDRVRVHVHYRYEPAAGSGLAGFDKRWFELARAGESWRVTGMGPAMSGRI